MYGHMQRKCMYVCSYERKMYVYDDMFMYEYMYVYMFSVYIYVHVYMQKIDF